MSVSQSLPDALQELSRHHRAELSARDRADFDDELLTCAETRRHVEASVAHGAWVILRGSERDRSVRHARRRAPS